MLPEHIHESNTKHPTLLWILVVLMNFIDTRDLELTGNKNLEKIDKRITLALASSPAAYLTHKYK